MLVLLLGSNLGHFDSPEPDFLLRSAIRDPGNLLLLGADLFNPNASCSSTTIYPLGVTASFNITCSSNQYRELSAHSICAFAHRAALTATNATRDAPLSRAAQA